MKPLFRSSLAGLAAAAIALVATPVVADGIDENPLARFEAPLCPGIIGMQADYAAAVIARIRTNAEQLGVETAPEGACEPNMIVAFLQDGQNYLQRLNQGRGWMFESLDETEKRRLLATTGPARAWITTETRTRDGLRIGRRENLNDLPQAAMWSAHSMIYVPTREDITASMVLIDRDALEGRSIDQLADFATLHGLADYVPRSASGVASIQNLFDSGSTAPDGLTAFDMAYLERLYSSMPNVPARTRLEGLEGVAKRD